MLAASLETVPPGVDAHAALEEVRARVATEDGPALGSAEDAEEYLRSDHMLVRFLVARQWDVEKATDMLRAHYRWLADKKMADLVREDFPEEEHIKRYYPQTYHGTDRCGRPIYIERPGLIDMPRLLQRTTPERLLQYMYAGSELQILRRFPACSVARGEVVDKSLNIMDLSGLGFRVVTHSIARRVLGDVVAVLQNHYPECSGRVIIINAPKVFSIAWSFVKPMLDEKTVAKISIFGHDREAYTETLLELVDADQLPALFGGRCICDGKDESSCMRSAKGPWADPHICRLVDEQPLSRLMTPEGARQCHRLLRGEHEQGATDRGETAAELNGAENEEKSDVEATSPGEENEEIREAPQFAVEEEAEEEEEEAEAEITEKAIADEVEEAPATAMGPGATTSIISGRLLAELKEAELEAALLKEEYEENEALHVSALNAWLAESARLVATIGRRVIERAQEYYDSQSLWNQATFELKHIEAAVEQATAELESAAAQLSAAEAAFVQAPDAPGSFSEADWERLAPLGAEELALANGDARLTRSLRLSSLMDGVCSLQARRETLRAEYAQKAQETEDLRLRFQTVEEEHAGCSWGCSVRRAEPFYVQRRVNEERIDAQLAILLSLESRLRHARRRVVAAATVATSAHSADNAGGAACVGSASDAPHHVARVDEVSLKQFELDAAASVCDAAAGSGDVEDDYHSCASDASCEETWDDLS